MEKVLVAAGLIVTLATSGKILAETAKTVTETVLMIRKDRREQSPTE